MTKAAMTGAIPPQGATRHESQVTSALSGFA